jgi:hypothetical protein
MELQPVAERQLPQRVIIFNGVASHHLWLYGVGVVLAVQRVEH